MKKLLRKWLFPNTKTIQQLKEELKSHFPNGSYYYMSSGTWFVHAGDGGCSYGSTFQQTLDMEINRTKKVEARPEEVLV